MLKYFWTRLFECGVTCTQQIITNWKTFWIRLATYERKKTIVQCFSYKLVHFELYYASKCETVFGSHLYSQMLLSASDAAKGTRILSPPINIQNLCRFFNVKIQKFEPDRVIRLHKIFHVLSGCLKGII